MMHKILASVAIASTLAAPTMAEARPVTFTAQMTSYGGPASYMVMYVTDAAGRYKGTLWMSGGQSKYYRHLRDWTRLSRGQNARVDGITGASVGSGRTLKVTLDLADALFDAGYNLHIDTSVEDYGDAPSEAIIPLKTSQSGKTSKGRKFLQSVSFEL